MPQYGYFIERGYSAALPLRVIATSLNLEIPGAGDRAVALAIFTSDSLAIRSMCPDFIAIGPRDVSKGKRMSPTPTARVEISPASRLAIASDPGVFRACDRIASWRNDEESREAALLGATGLAGETARNCRNLPF